MTVHGIGFVLSQLKYPVLSVGLSVSMPVDHRRSQHAYADDELPVINSRRLPTHLSTHGYQSVCQFTAISRHALLHLALVAND
jgi:hypothetical protein